VKTKRVPLKGGEEHDMLTRWRRFVKHTAGKAKAAKRSYNKRLRKTARSEEKDNEKIN
tara:strand:+ start:342 stop:515 length:174 start_codon:yes stop_codon:yes gene_type:complete